MPIFEYQCNECETRFEVLERANDTCIALKCPGCGKENSTKRLSTFATGATQKGTDIAGAT